MALPLQSAEHVEDAPVVLLTEDNLTDRRYLEYMLRRMGYNVEVAGDGHEAYEKTLQVKPDAILMDIMLPHVDGLTAIRMLRNNVETRNIPIIVTTCLNSEADAAKCLAAGADVHLGKPVTPDGLKDSLARFISPPDSAS